MPRIFHDFDFAEFWDDSDYALDAYVDDPPSDELISSVETELGVKLPASYIELMRMHNGGTPHNRCFPTKTPTSWAEDHVAITGILGIGRDKPYSLCGQMGSRFMQEEWGYPDIGIYVCDCPSAGHDIIMLDYRVCGAQGEPEVVHVDQEPHYKITYLAKDFEAFVRGLVNESEYDTSDDDLKAALKIVDKGSLSTVLAGLIADTGDPTLETVIRNVCRTLSREKGYFALHGDELSWLVYDILFYLYTASNEVRDKDAYLEVYPDMIAFGDGGLTTGGYAPAFVETWITKRLSKKDIVASPDGKLTLSDKFQSELDRRIRAHSQADS